MVWLRSGWLSVWLGLMFVGFRFDCIWFGLALGLVGIGLDWLGVWLRLVWVGFGFGWVLVWVGFGFGWRWFGFGFG